MMYYTLPYPGYKEGSLVTLLPPARVILSCIIMIVNTSF